jgi:hypothetical protein
VCGTLPSFDIMESDIRVQAIDFLSDGRQPLSVSSNTLTGRVVNGKGHCCVVDCTGLILLLFSSVVSVHF